MKPSKTAISVLGMHRSGTSSITKGIHEIGAYIGEYGALVPPDIDNPRGFWEHQRIVDLHDEALRAMGLSWDTTTPIPDSWLQEPSVLRVRNQIRDVVVNEFAEHELWVWKDPRTCLFVPMWEDILSELSIEPKYVIVIRNPVDVAQSLLQRNGFLWEKSYALWLNHTLASLRSTRGKPRVVIEYDDYMQDWKVSLKQVASALDIQWPENDTALNSQMSSFLVAALQHSRSNPEEALQSLESSLVRDLYGLCRDAIRNPDLLQDDTFISKINRIDREYKCMFKMFSSHIHRFTAECLYQSELKQQNVVKVETQGPVDDEFHEYFIEMPGAVGNRIIFIPMHFPCMFDIASITIQKRGRTGMYEDVDWITAANLAQFPGTILSMTFPGGGVKFLNLDGTGQINIPYVFHERGDYALRASIRVYRQDHPVYANVIRQALPVYDAQVRRAGTSVNPGKEG